MTSDTRDSWKPAIGRTRSPDRIPVILEALRKAWEANPDMRFGQLVEVISDRFTGNDAGRIFYMEDTTFMTEIEYWTKEK